MLKISNIQIHNSLNTIKAWDYFYFTLYYRLFEASSSGMMQEIVTNENDTITKLRLIQEEEDIQEKDKQIENLCKHLENRKMGYHNSVQGVGYHFFAFASLIEKVDGQKVEVNVADTEALFELVQKVQNLSSFQITDEIRSIAEQMQEQLIKAFPEIFESNEDIQEFEYIKNTLLRINLDASEEEAIQSAKEVIWDIHRYFFQRLENIECNPNAAQDYMTEYLTTTTQHYQTLEFTEPELKESSVFAFYAKHLKNKKEIEEFKKKQQNQV